MTSIVSLVDQAALDHQEEHGEWPEQVTVAPLLFKHLLAEIADMSRTETVKEMSVHEAMEDSGHAYVRGVRVDPDHDKTALEVVP